MATVGHQPSSHDCLKFSIDKILSAAFGQDSTSQQVEQQQWRDRINEQFVHHYYYSSLAFPTFTTTLSVPHELAVTQSFDTIKRQHWPNLECSATFNHHQQQPQQQSHHVQLTTKKKTWSRAVFSALQRKGLETHFKHQKYITKPDRRKLAETLGLSDSQVKVWFQNRRMKWRHSREYRQEHDHERGVVQSIEADDLISNSN